ncbi:hypothetical protein P4W15_18990 [Morganella morganii]|nr:hypothetical protein [Morganella morganii]
MTALFLISKKAERNIGNNMTLNKLALVLGFGMSVVAGAASAADQGHGTDESPNDFGKNH